MIRKTGIIAALVACVILSATAGERSKTIDSVDWGKGLIISHGIGRVSLSDEGRPQDLYGGGAISLNRGRVNADNEAREQAVEKMFRMVRGIRVDADTLLEEILEQDPVFQSRITRVVTGRTKMREYPVDFAASGCRAELRIGDLLLAIPYRYPGDPFPSRIDNPIPTDYTGLVIDARGLGVEPMILPSIFDENGLEIYGRYMVDIRHASRHGIVAYARSEEEAMNYRAAGERPYYTVALKGLKGCPVLADRDVRKIFSGRGTVEQLKKCRVVFIIDKVKQ